MIEQTYNGTIGIHAVRVSKGSLLDMCRKHNEYCVQESIVVGRHCISEDEEQQKDY